MLVKLNISALSETRWYQYLVRFLLGGLITAGAGIIAKKFGPSIGGLFLAFPAIFPASVTLVEKHERERKEDRGLEGKQRARDAAAADAAGATMGSIGLIVFAVVIWKLLPVHAPWSVISGGTLVWAAVSSLVWFGWKRDWFLRYGEQVLASKRKAPRGPDNQKDLAAKL